MTSHLRVWALQFQILQRNAKSWVPKRRRFKMRQNQCQSIITHLSNYWFSIKGIIRPYLTCMTSEGPPATISCGMPESGQFSMLMICKLEHSASSNGKLCRFGLSFMYRDSRLSKVPKHDFLKTDVSKNMTSLTYFFRQTRKQVLSGTQVDQIGQMTAEAKMRSWTRCWDVPDGTW